MSIKLTMRQWREMSADALEKYLGGQIGVIYVDNQPRFRVISYVAKMAHDDNQRKYVPPKPGDVVMVKGRAMVVPELDMDGQPMPNYGF